jgi:hypothetical protein
LYPKHGPCQWIAGFLGAIILAMGITATQTMVLSRLFFETLTPVQIVLTIGLVIANAIIFSLLVSGRIQGWRALAGLGLGLLIGIGLCVTNLQSSAYYVFSPLWLSAVFFLELFSHRAGWRTVLVGLLLWLGLIALSVQAAHFS